MPALIQPAVSNYAASGTTVSASFARNITPGSTIVVCLGTSQLTNSPAVAGAGAGSNDTYAYFNGASGIVQNWYCLSSVGGYTTINISNIVAGYSFLYLYEVPACYTLDVSAEADGSNVNPNWTSVSSGYTNYPAEFWVGLAYVTLGTGITGPGAPWANLTPYVGASGAIVSGYQFASSTSSAWAYSGTSASAGPTSWYAAVATFATNAGTGANVTGAAASVTVAAYTGVPFGGTSGAKNVVGVPAAVTAAGGTGVPAAVTAVAGVAVGISARAGTGYTTGLIGPANVTGVAAAVGEAGSGGVPSTGGYTGGYSDIYGDVYGGNTGAGSFPLPGAAAQAGAAGGIGSIFGGTSSARLGAAAQTGTAGGAGVPAGAVALPPPPPAPFPETGLGITVELSLGNGCMFGNKNDPVTGLALPLIGVYRGNGGTENPDGTVVTSPTPATALGNVEAYETACNRQMDFVLDYVLDAPTTWAQFEGAYVTTSIQAGIWSAAVAGGRRLCLSLPACAGVSAGSGGATWAAEAAGTNDAHWTALGSYLIENGFGSSMIRIGREFNGNWYHWSPTTTGDTVAQYVAGWQHIVTLLRGLPGANFVFCWNPILGPFSTGGAEVQNWFPGTAYVDSIGLDLYDWGDYPSVTPPPFTRTIAQQEANWNYLETIQDGIESWTAFVTTGAAAGVPFSFPEWGLVTWKTGGSYIGGGDDPYYIYQMASLILANTSYGQGGPACYMSAYWEDATSGLLDPDTVAARNFPVALSRAAFFTSANVWADITAYVYSRNNIQITSGQPDEATAPNPSTCALTLNNRDGRFTLRNPLGAYYGQISRNSQLRVSVQTTTVQGSPRVAVFWGEVSEWPPSWDPTGTDVYASITASGILRRLSQGGTLGSALLRYWTSLSGTLAPAAYWPCEDLAGSTNLASGINGQPMFINGTPTLASNTSFSASMAIPLLSNSSWTGRISEAKLGSASITNASVTYTTGSGSFTPPAGTTSGTVDMWAPGDGGGGSSSSSWGGGAGGAFVSAPGYQFTPGNPVNWSIPAPGAGGTSGPGGSAGAAIFGTLIAPSGTGGTSIAGGIPGGVSSADPIFYPGGAGGAPGNAGGGGGSSGGPSQGGKAGGSGATSAGIGGVVSGGGSGGPGGASSVAKSTHISYYSATATYSYNGYGNLVSNPAGYVYQGDANDSNGNIFSYLVFDYGQIQSDLAGAAITNVNLVLQNLGSYYPTGMYVTLGWGTITSFGSTSPIGSVTEDQEEWWINQGQLLSHNITSVGSWFQSSATCLLLYKAVDSQYNYGYFAGAEMINPPQLQFTYIR